MQVWKKLKLLRGNTSQLCCDISTFQYRFDSTVTLKIHPKKCAVYRDDTHSECEVCGKPFHLLPSLDEHMGKGCFIASHSDLFFGLTKKILQLYIKKKRLVTPITSTETSAS